jgi:hypothetical protein
MALLVRNTGWSIVISLDDALSVAGPRVPGNDYQSTIAMLQASFVVWCASPVTGCWVIYEMTPPHSDGRHHICDDRPQWLRSVQG